jgi:hypothetical protein
MPNLGLHTAIQELLLRDQFACIPRLGGFLLRPADSTVNAYTKELKPTHSQLVFNAQLSENDGQLAHLLSVSQGISYKDAMLQIEAIVSELNTQLQQKRYATFFPFGNFFQNENKGVFFVARQQFNLHLPNYGLQPLKWDSKASADLKTFPEKAQTLSSDNRKTNEEISHLEDAQVIEVSEDHIEILEKKQQTNIWWNIAASFAVISVSALTLTIASLTWVGAYQEKQAYASLNPLIHASEPDQSNESKSADGNSSQLAVKESSYLYINGGLVKIGADNKKNSDSDSQADLSLGRNSINHQNVDVEKKHSELNLLDADVYHSYLIDKKKGSFFLISGSYMTPKAAKIECQQWISHGTPAAIFKPQNSSFYRIVLGRFVTKEELSEYSVIIKTIPNANLSMTRWNLR